MQVQSQIPTLNKLMKLVGQHETACRNPQNDVACLTPRNYLQNLRHIDSQEQALPAKPINWRDLVMHQQPGASTRKLVTRHESLMLLMLLGLAVRGLINVTNTQS